MTTLRTFRVFFRSSLVPTKVEQIWRGISGRQDIAYKVINTIIEANEYWALKPTEVKD